MKNEQDLRSRKLGWIGTGRMGYAMAKRLLEAGCDVNVYNRTRSKAEALEPFECRHTLNGGTYDPWLSVGFLEQCRRVQLDDDIPRPADLVDGRIFIAVCHFSLSYTDFLTAAGKRDL